MFPSGTDKHCFPYAVLTVEHGRTHRRESGIQLVFCQGRSMLAGLKLRAHILQRLIHVFEDLVRHTRYYCDWSQNLPRQIGLRRHNWHR